MTLSTPRRALLGAVAVGVLTVGTVLLSPSAALERLESLADDPLAFGVAVGVLYLVRPLLAWPTTPLAVVVGYGFGVAVGVPIALAGVVVTVLPVFAVARRLTAGGRLDERDGGPFGIALERTGAAVNRYYETAGPVRGVTASRLAPIPSDVATCAAAVSGVSIRQLAVGTAVGELPWTIGAVAVGASAATVTTDGLGALGAPLAVGCAVGAALLLAGPAYEAARGRFTGTS